MLKLFRATHPAGWLARAGLLVLLAALLPGCARRSLAERVREGDPQDRAAAVVENLGGEDALEHLHYLNWEVAEFDGGKELARRMYVWDRQSGNVRLETYAAQRPVTILFNTKTEQGTAYDGVAHKRLDDSDAIVKQAIASHERDVSWLLGFAKLTEPNAVVADGGVQEIDGDEYPTLYLTFQDPQAAEATPERPAPPPVPQDRYWFHLDPETGRPAAWTLARRGGKAPVVYKWTGWGSLGGLRLPTTFERVGSPRRIVIDNLYAPGEVNHALFSEPGPKPRKRTGAAAAGSATPIR